MQTEPPASLPPQTFPIAYQAFLRSEYNLDFRGDGEFAFRPEGPTYIFSGRERLPFWRGRQKQMEFGAGDIRDVAVKGTAVMFQTDRGRTGAKKQSFRFYCRDEAQAAKLAALLPQEKGADFIQAQAFRATLDSIPGGPSSWASLTNLLIATNAVVFVAMAAFLGAGWFDSTELMPYVRFGANNGGATTDGEWWRLATSMFMHFGIVHLLLNMWALFMVGHLAEKLFGRLSYAVVYLGGGIVGGLASIIWHGDKLWSAGASGAIFAVYGALLGYMLREKQSLPRAVFQPLFKSTVVFAGYNLIYGLAHPGIDNAAHIGGIVGGFAIGWAAAVPVELGERTRLLRGRRLAGGIAAMILIVVGIALAPRFEYHFADELAWGDANKGQVEKEESLMKRLQPLLSGFEPGRPAETLTALLGDEIIPFYAEWQKRVDALHLSLDRQTARRRAALSKFCELRVENFRHLIAGVRSRDPSAMLNFMTEDTRARAEVAKMGELK
jgi:rhomboid protease GluP